ncbi:MAG: hypothetical protein ACKVS6_17010 [Planctomycetota bacterium]
MISKTKHQSGTIRYITNAALAAAVIVMIVGARISFGEQGQIAPKPKPACPDQAATSTATSQTTGATTTCTDGTACGFSVTVTHTSWSCADSEGTECLTDSAAPQVQVFKWDCKDVEYTNPPVSTCTQSGPTNVTTMVGKKTKSCN